MSTDNPLIISPTTELDTAQVSDRAIAQINRSFNRFYQERRQEVMEALRQLPSMLMVLDELTTGTSYEALVSPEVMKKVQAGKATWDQYADGFYGAVIRDTETGQIVCHVKLREVTPELLSSLNQLAVQRTLAEIVQKLEAIDQKVTTVLQGQRNDRLAIAESGIHLYEQAIAAANLDTRRQLLMQSIDQLNEGRQRLQASLETDMQSFKLPDGAWNLLRRALFRDLPEEIEQQVRPIQEAFQAMLRASYVLALAYEALDEPESLQVSLQQLHETLLEVGARGQKLARWLPYDASSPPEELWQDSILMLEQGLLQTKENLALADSRAVAFAFQIDEMNRGGGNG